MSVAGGVGQVIFVGAVTVVAVEEAEVGLAAGKIHNYIQCSAQRRDARRLISQWSGLLYVCDRPRSLICLSCVQVINEAYSTTRLSVGLGQE